jgi:hypothetical protein
MTSKNKKTFRNIKYVMNKKIKIYNDEILHTYKNIY